jgi:acyl dehydratase
LSLTNKESINMNQQLPETGFLRASQILGDAKHPPIIPVKKTTWWQGVKTGRFPKPVSLGARVTAWRVEDIRAWIAAQGAQA